MNFRYRLMQFMSGRYGVDTTFYILFGVSAVIAFINIIFRIWALQAIVYAIIAFAIYRMFSRNHAARMKENRIITSGFTALTKWYYTRKTRAADTTHVYKKCPNCKAVLRLPRRKGRHSTVCPNCHMSFSVRVYKD